MLQIISYNRDTAWIFNFPGFVKVAELLVKNNLVAPIVELLGGAFDLKKEVCATKLFV